MPIAPPIVFGILSKRVTFAGAAAAVLVGMEIERCCSSPTRSRRGRGGLCSARVARRRPPVPLAAPSVDVQLRLSRRRGHGLSFTAVLFLVSAFTKKTDPEKLALGRPSTGVGRPEPFRGLERLAAARNRASGGDSRDLLVALVA